MQILEANAKYKLEHDLMHIAHSEFTKTEIGNLGLT